MKYLKKVFCDRETYILTVILIPILTIIFCLDYKDVIVDYIVSKDWMLSLIVGVGVILLGLIVFWGNHYLDLFHKIATVNILDRVLSLCIISEIVYFGFLIFIYQASTYKIIVLLSIFIFCVGLLVYRWIRYSILMKSASTIESQVLDLKQLLEIESSSNISYPILISEKDVDYDLFERNEIIFQLETAIEISCKSELPFVIGLSGKWGHGKTTILNIVKRYFLNNNKIEVIDSFDPWKYASSKAILAGIYYTILHNTGVHYSEGQINDLINTVCDFVAETSEKVGKIGKLTKKVLLQEGNNDSIDTLKSKIDEYLTLKDKTVVLIIDNLDRASAENVRFLFKLVGAIFDFKRVKYVLSYDKERLYEIFRDSLQIDPHYMEKIINQELVVPKIPENSRESVYRRCIHNLLLLYKVDSSRLPDYDFIINFIVDNVQDIRMFKRLLNSAFFLSFGKNSLYKPDLLTLEIVRFLDIELYEAIYHNKEFFIDVDTDYDIKLFRASLRKKEFNEECKVFYDELFKNKKHYQQLLTNLFPYVNRYEKGSPIKQDGYLNSEEYKKTQLYCRINSAKYFDLYFCYSLNDFSNFSVEFNNSLEKILSLSEERIKDAFSKYINITPVGTQNEWALKLFLFKDEIKNPAAYPILNSLFDNIQIISDERGFLSPSPRDRVYGVMTDLYKKINKANQDNFISKVSNNINKLFVITNMIYWLEENTDDVTKNNLNNCAQNISNRIIDKNINIYDDLNYANGNIWSVYKTLKSSNTPNYQQIIKSYISKVLTPKTVYRVLRDTVVCSIGRGYGYYISKESFNLLFDENTNIQELMKKNPPCNDSEKLIFDLYKDYVKYSGNMQPEHERYYDSSFVFEL